MALGSDYTSCTVLVYAPNNKYITEDTISEHDKKQQWIELRRGLPQSLRVADICSLLILTAPSPCEYKGRVVRDMSRFVFALFKGQEKENRRMERYAVNFTATVEALIIDGEIFPLFEILAVNIINISRTGVRFSAPSNSFLVRDRFTLRMKISGNDRLFTAVAVNSVDRGCFTEYGCRLIGE
ncbi:MAG: PilZ domain-containing protein [Defluviitaleaceae bacterium]|nr:PilZ domain-containing protein [Defluviitaleaceae bacterium]